MAAQDPTKLDIARQRLLSGQAWDDYCDTLKVAGRQRLAVNEDLTFATRFLPASLHTQCVLADNKLCTDRVILFEELFIECGFEGRRIAQQMIEHL